MIVVIFLPKIELGQVEDEDFQGNVEVLLVSCYMCLPEIYYS